MFGKRNGLGTMIFSSDKRSTSLAIGQWKNNMPSEELPWKMTFGTCEYFGNIIIKKKNCEQLSFEDFLKNDQGELSDKKSDFKYFGYFKDNKKEGFGVATFSNGDQYYGSWKDDYLHDFGTYYYKDGTIFQGTFRRGIKKGKGTMYMPNGDTIEGKWMNDKIKDATYNKGSTKDCHITMLNQMLNDIQETLRLNGNVGFLINQDGYNNGPPTRQKWHSYFVLNTAAWSRESDILLSKLVINNAKKTDKRDEQYVLNTIDDVKRVFQILFDGNLERDTNGFVNGLVQFFIGAFQGKYNTSAYTASQLRRRISALMSHAIDDTKSFIEYLSELLVGFMTNVLDKILETFTNPNLKNVVDNINTDAKIGEENAATLQNLKTEVQYYGQILIANHIHAKAFRTFFPMYEVAYQEEDLLMNQKINSVPNCSLQSMGVDKKFFAPISEQGTPYAKSISVLEKLPQERNVAGKVAVLALLRDTIMTEVRNNRTANRRAQFERQKKEYTDQDREEDDNWQAGADDVTSVYSFVFTRARIRNHHAQFHYVNDWKDHIVVQQAVVHLITFYEGFPSFVYDLDPNLKTEEGQLISTYTISKSLERGVQKASKKMKNQPVGFYWLPSLLCHIGLEIGGLKINTTPLQARQSLIKGEFSPIDVQSPTDSPTIGYKNTMVIPRDQEILDMNNQNLKDTLIDNVLTVRRVLSFAAPDIGFNIVLESETGENGEEIRPAVVIEFSRVYPSHVYSELSLVMSKFVRFELDYLLD
jgi:hypothetical protein